MTLTAWIALTRWSGPALESTGSLNSSMIIRSILRTVRPVRIRSD